MDAKLLQMEDSRFKKLDFSINEYQLMEEAEIIQKLQTLRLSPQYLDFNQMKLQVNYLFARPIIPLKLECETDPQRRFRIVESSFTTMQASEDNYGETLYDIGFGLSVATGILTLLSVGSFCCSDSSQGWGLCCAGANIC